MSPAILAHQWGWDELLYFAVPVVAMLVWVRWAEKRARSRKQAQENRSGPGGETKVG